jgi:regulator of protease activity HflC (stomatin/prohibitin superfamily)
MGFFIGAIIAIITVVCGVWAFIAFDNDSRVMGTIAVLLCIAGVIAFFIVPFSFHTVESGEIAVVKTFGEAKEAKGPGLNYDFWAVNEYVYLDTKEQSLDTQSLAYSSDAQPMTMDINLKYRILTDKAIDIVNTYGTIDILNTHMQAIIIERPKTVTSMYAAMDIIANRSQATTEMVDAITEALNNAGYPVVITSITVTNIDFSDAFEAAVEEKMIAEQTKLKAEYENDTKLYDLIMQKSISSLKKAKLLHDDLEKYYIPHMNFSNIDSVYNEVCKNLI